MQIKHFLYLTGFVLTFSAGIQLAGSCHNQLRQRTDTSDSFILKRSKWLIESTKLFSQSDAEMILGEAAHLTDSSTILASDTLTLRAAYSADTKDQETGKTGNIYYLFEQFAKQSIAKKIYTGFRISNANHPGFKILQDLGDEAYYHSDNENFALIIVRKGEKLLRMKVNKLTSKTSLNNFTAIAKKLTNSL